MKVIKIFCLSLILTGTYFTVNAQIIGLRISTGNMVYVGDISNGIDLDFLQPLISLGLNYEVYPKLDLDASLLLGSLNGNNRKDKSFNTKIDQVNITAKYYFNKMSEYDSKLGFYTGLGLGVVRFNPKGYSNTTKTFIELQPLKNEGVSYNLIAFEATASFGVSWQINKTFVLTAQSNFHQPFTDYIDDISKRVNPSDLDFYLSNTVGLIYRIGNDTDMNSHGKGTGPNFFQ